MNLSSFQYISCEHGSFTRFTLEKRLPAILDRVIASGLFDSRVQSKLESIKGQLPHLPIKPFSLSLFEKDDWGLFFEQYLGKVLTEIPFFFAEIYFYRSLLEATGYSTNGIDPFSTIKAQELIGKEGAFEKLLEHVDSTISAIHASLAGNKADLSQLNRADAGLHLLIDHSDELAKAIKAQNTIHLILDNAGTELFSDLLLVQQILLQEQSKKIKLYPKMLPVFVSDTTAGDIRHLLHFLSKSEHAGLQQLADQLQAQMERGMIEVIAEPFWNSPNHFTRLPDQMKAHIRPNDVVISKGDANYRRFFEDRKIPADYRGDVAAISANQFAIRTLKSEIVAGLDLTTITSLQDDDPSWMVNGKYAVVQSLRF